MSGYESVFVRVCARAHLRECSIPVSVSLSLSVSSIVVSLALAAASSQFGSHRTAPKRTPGSVKPYATFHLFVLFFL